MVFFSLLGLSTLDFLSVDVFHIFLKSISGASAGKLGLLGQALQGRGSSGAVRCDEARHWREGD